MTNVILVNLDGFRVDKIDRCQFLNQLKDKCLFFPKMFTVAPYTFASLHSVFTSYYPSMHGVDAYYNIFKFKNEISTLPQILQSSGYYTSCDIISEVVIPKKGLDEVNIFDEKTVDFESRHRDIIKRLSEKDSFFLFLHYTEPHKHLVDAVIQKYKQESNDDEYFNSYKENNARYESYLPSLDNYVKMIMDTLKETGIDSETILILFSDHGTSLGEKQGEKFYGVYTYDYTINVFSMMFIPNKQPIKILKQCQTIDIAPTILDLLKIDYDLKSIQGKSLLPFIDNQNEPDRTVFVETGGLYGPWPSPKKHNVFCIRKNNKKIIYNDSPQTWEFYDLESDPNEQNNIYSDSSKIILEYKDELLSYLNLNKIKTNLT
jgi:arylsulfatase A-like enzyme